MDFDIKIAQLLSSRICHDLINPINAVTFSLDICKNEENIDLRKDAVNLAYESANILSNKVSFFRLALGATTIGEGKSGLAKTKNIIYSLFQEKEIFFEWSEKVDEALEMVATNINLKILLNIFLTIFYCIPKSAKITLVSKKISLDTFGIAFIVEGGGVRLSLDTLKTMNHKDIDQLTPRNIQTYITFAMSKEASAKIEMQDTTQNKISIATAMKIRV